jgi:hypothetical protein
VVFEAEGVDPKKEKRVIEDFTMSEIDLLERSNFSWTDLKMGNGAIMAAGFNSWCCVFKNNDIWLAVGGDKNAKEQTIETKLVYKGGKLQALAAGNDFLYKYETHDSATKAGLWRNERPTKKQRKWLPPEFKRDRKITRGDAGAILTFKIVAAHKIRELEASFSLEK